MEESEDPTHGLFEKMEEVSDILLEQQLIKSYLESESELDEEELRDFLIMKKRVIDLLIGKPIKFQKMLGEEMLASFLQLKIRCRSGEDVSKFLSEPEGN